MALPYYFLATIFLGAIIVTLFCLVGVYKLASDYLDGKYSYDKLDGEPEEGDEEDWLVFVEKPSVEAQEKNPIPATPEMAVITPIEEEPSQETEFDMGLIEVEFKYIAANSYLSCLIRDIIGFHFEEEKGPSKLRFHVNLSSPGKVRRHKTASIPLTKQKLTIPFGFKNVREQEVRESNLRLRLYGRREKLGVTVGKEICYGEANLPLNKIKLDEAGSIYKIKIVATAPSFPLKERTDF